MRTKARKYGKSVPKSGRYRVGPYPHRFASDLEARVFADSMRKNFRKEVKKFLRKSEARRARTKKEAHRLLKRLF